MCLLLLNLFELLHYIVQVFSDESKLDDNEINDLRERFATFFFQYAKEKNEEIDYDEYL